MTGYLLDSSVLHRTERPAVAERLCDLEDRRLALCPPVILEMAYSARSATERDAKLTEWRIAYDWVWMSEAVQRRAIEVQGLLTERGQHRGPGKLGDVLIAATAEAHGLTVLHYDSDFDTIAGVTGQPVEWVVPRGSVD